MMDLDEIDAAGTAAMFADGAKSATLILPTGAHCPCKVWLTAAIEEFRGDDLESTGEQRWAITLENAQHAGVPDAKVQIGSDTYRLKRRLDGDKQVTTWEVRKVG